MTQTNESKLKKALERRIRENIENVKHNAVTIKGIVDEFLLDESGERTPNITAAAMLIHNTNCLKIVIGGVETNYGSLSDLTKLYNMDDIGMEYEYYPKIHKLTLYLYPLEYRIPDWVNFGHPDNRRK